MRRYWDSSALVDALHDTRVEALAKEADQWTRYHTLSESFAVLTGGKLGVRYQPDDAVALLREITATFQFIDLELSEIWFALENAQKKGVRGGNVHDWLHVRAAAKAKVSELLTDNLADFVNLADGFKVIAP